MNDDTRRGQPESPRELSREDARRRRRQLLREQQAAADEADRREQDGNDATVAPFVLPGGD